MLCGFQSNLRYNSSTILCACTYWIEIAFTITSAYFKVYHFQKASGKYAWKWVPYSAYSLQTVSRFVTSHSILYEQGPWDGAYRFFLISRRLESLTVCRWHRAALLVSYLKILIDNWSGRGLKPRLPATSRPVFIHLELTGRRFTSNSAVFHYQVNLRLSRQKWEF